MLYLAGAPFLSRPMKTSSTLRFTFLLLLLAPLSPAAEDTVRAGAGSYAARAPEGAKLPPETIWRTANVRGPMPTNDWWSSLAWVPLSDVMYPHPLAVRAVGGGLRVYYPRSSARRIIRRPS